MINNEILGLDGVKIRVWASVSQSKTQPPPSKKYCNLFIVYKLRI